MILVVLVLIVFVLILLLLLLLLLFEFLKPFFYEVVIEFRVGILRIELSGAVVVFEGFFPGTGFGFWFGNRLAENPRMRPTAEETWEFCLNGLGGPPSR